jgi:hypothetical protein
MSFFSLAGLVRPEHCTHTAVHVKISTERRWGEARTLLSKEARAGGKVGGPHGVIDFYEALHVFIGYLKLK